MSGPVELLKHLLLFCKWFKAYLWCRCFLSFLHLVLICLSLFIQSCVKFICTILTVEAVAFRVSFSFGSQNLFPLERYIVHSDQTGIHSDFLDQKLHVFKKKLPPRQKFGLQMARRFVRNIFVFAQAYMLQGTIPTTGAPKEKN